LLILGALGLTVAAGIFTAGWAAQPLLSLNRAAKLLTQGTPIQPVSGGMIKEIRELTLSFNAMTHQLQQLDPVPLIKEAVNFLEHTIPENILGEKGVEPLAQGVVDWFQKPVSLQKLARIIRRALSIRRSRRE
jgi:HAMP domain-containing protein